MTNVILPEGRLAEGEFRISHIFSLALSVFRRNYLKVTLVAAVAFLPLLAMQLMVNPATLAAIGTNIGANPGANLGAIGGLAVLALLLFVLCQAVLLHAAFQGMTGKSVNVFESTSVGLRRFFPVIGVALIWTAALALYVILLSLLIAAISRLVQSSGLTILITLI